MIDFKRIWIVYVCCCLFFAVSMPDLEWLIAIEEESITLEMPEELAAVFNLDNIPQLDKI